MWTNLQKMTTLINLLRKLVIREKRKKSKKKKKLKYEDAVNCQSSALPMVTNNEPFYEDKKQDKNNFLVTTLSRPAVPKYDRCSFYFKRYYSQTKKQKKFIFIYKPRYFKLKPTKSNVKTEEVCDDDHSAKEEELTRITEDFNKRLAANPRDVNCWLQYVEFQNDVSEFEKAYRQNSSGGAERVAAERKLSILDRAIKSNPISEELLAAKLVLSEQVLSVEQLIEECWRALAQDPGSLMLWRALVRTSLNNMARCTVPAVLQLYTKAISRINQFRRLQPSISVEMDIMSLVFECGLFLQQAGLFEQLFTVLQMYLSLSLTTSGEFHVPIPNQQEGESALQQKEDEIVTCGLPAAFIWLKVENLRASHHFLPDNKCDSDPQRVVFTDDVAGLVQPIVSASMRLPLTVMALVLLKVPLLPTRHSVLACLRLQDTPSAVCNLEWLLPAVSSTHDCSWIEGLQSLLTAPQFVRESGPYLGWVVRVMQLCAELLPTDESVLIHIWTLRLYGLLGRLRSCRLVDVTESIDEQGKAYAKRLLKLPQFRSNLLLYMEYALMERDLGCSKKASKTLETTLSMVALSETNTEPDLSHIMLSKELVLCILSEDYESNRETAVKVLVALVNRKPVSTTSPSDIDIKRSLARWQSQTTSLVDFCMPQAHDTLSVASAMSPHILVEWLTCHAILLSLTQTVWEAAALLQKYIDLLNTDFSSDSIGSLWAEQLYEALVDILYSHSERTKTGCAVLRDTLSTALSRFPNNLRLLGIVAAVEIKNGGGTPIWRLARYFPSQAPLPQLFLVFIVRCRLTQNHQINAVEAAASCRSFLNNLLHKLINQPITNSCPLVWRLYLQNSAISKSQDDIKQAFYKCLSACPWVKAFYLDGMRFLPEVSNEIVDLIIEKELRLHITLEEVEILRS